MEQITIQPELTPEDPQYIEEMAKKGEAALNAGNTHRDPQTDTGVPKKFMTEDGQVNVDALLKSYQELEKKMSQPKAPQPEVKAEAPVEDNAEAKDESQVNETDQARELVTSTGIDFDGLTKEFAEKGQLTDDAYAKLDAAGIPKATVDAYIQGQMALAEKYQSEALASIGGKEAYSEITDWARNNLTQGQLQAYNNAVASSDMDTVQLAVQGLKAQYDRANGAAPKRQLMGSTGSSGDSVKPFMSRTQYVDAIKDGRYDRDPAYRAEVLARLKMSDII